MGGTGMWTGPATPHPLVRSARARYRAVSVG
jgi:hypothetical protein